MAYQFPVQAKAAGITLSTHFQQFTNLHALFRKVNGDPAASKCRSLEEMLSFSKLKEKKLPLKAKTDCQSLLRILYRLHKTQTTGKSGLEDTKVRERSRSRENDKAAAGKQSTVKLTCIAPMVEAIDIQTFFHQIPLKSVAFGYDTVSYCMVDLENVGDIKEALSFSGRALNGVAVQGKYYNFKTK